MQTRKATLFLASAALLMTAACKKVTDFRYKTSCTQCKVTYYDEDGKLVSQEAHTGSFEKEISVPRFNPIMVAVQSTVCPNAGACDSSLFVNDVITIELWKGSEKICGDTSTGKKLQAVTCNYVWPK